jgi:hypothetical protein
MTLFDECYSASDCNKSIRENYSLSPIVVVGDGVRAPFGATFLKEPGIHYQESLERLRVFPNGGRWLQRLFGAMLCHKADYYVKLDPDTRFLRRFTVMPCSDVWGFFRHPSGLASGNMCITDKEVVAIPYLGKEFLTGACIGFTREALIKIFSSQVLLDLEFQSYKYAFTFKRKNPDETLSICSWILDDAIDKLGLKKARHPEILLRWRESVPESEYADFAVVNVETSESDHA